MVIVHFNGTHQTNSTFISPNRRVGGGRLDGLLTQSPHTPVAGCTTTMSCDGDIRDLVLTNSSHNFVAWMNVKGCGNGIVCVSVLTTEAPVRVRGAFKDRFLLTTQLARVALRRVAPYVFDGQVDDNSYDDDDSDGHGGGWDDLDDDINGEDSGGDSASADEENGA
ncbi:unnamed protein product [Vitrella brassicaformis CCMP3155]|uniref:Uncharacterized protein n=1 Tax=Vitrella brassicaformis (strain CCMP3155) TaxID=1169540 RepID=A0A0G4GA38_VITBC|nr:unnamed protein product [Vitrella brassicaformis CCMP3155]|eukprot:CEM25417.1 unnamed protein product [Vitrella brassicaformis CCMP3155]